MSKVMKGRRGHDRMVEELCLVFSLYLFVFFCVIHDVNVCIYVEESY
jgi:hypothetical protein